MLGGFVPAETISLLGGGAAGMIGSELLLDRIPVDFLKSGWGRIGGKIILGVLSWIALRRVAPKIALGLFAGAGIGAVRDVVANFMQGGVNGLAGPDAITPGGGAGQIFLPAGVPGGQQQTFVDERGNVFVVG